MRATGSTAAELADCAVSFLSRLRVPEARPSVEFIMAHVLGTDRLRARLEGERVLGPALRRRFLVLVRKRGRRLPLSYILGHGEFHGLRILTGPGVLCPRPETEELAAEACRLLEKELGTTAHPRRILDIGTGTGCIAVFLAKRFPDASVTGTDISAKALSWAARNARLHGVAGRVSYIREDLFRTSRARRFDLVVSNPPYIPSRRIARLPPEVGFEPRLALDGGADGLDAIRAIVRAAPRLLVPGGGIALEMDRLHGKAVRALLEAAGFARVSILKDYQGFDRIASGLWKG